MVLIESVVTANRAIKDAWLMLWHNKILFVYGIFSLMFFILYYQVARWIRSGQVVFLIMLLLFSFDVIVRSAFCYNALARLNQTRMSFVESFKLGKRYNRIVLWGVLFGIYTVLVEVLTSYYAPILFVCIMGLINVVLLIGLVYLPILFVSTQLNLPSAIKRALQLAWKTWHILVLIFVELLAMAVVILIIGEIVILFFGYNVFQQYMYVTPVINVAVSLFMLLFSATAVILYQKIMLQGQQEIINQIPPYNL